MTEDRDQYSEGAQHLNVIYPMLRLLRHWRCPLKNAGECSKFGIEQYPLQKSPRPSVKTKGALSIRRRNVPDI